MQRYERVSPLNTSIIRKKNVFWTQISVLSVITRKIDFQELTLRARTVFKNFIKKCRQFRCTGLLHSSKTSTLTRQKFGFFYAEFSVEFNELILFFLKATGSGRKVTKTKVVQKNANRRRSETKG